MSVLAGIFCGFILNIFHILLSLYFQIGVLKCYFLKILYNLNYLFCNKLKRYETETEIIAKNIKNFSKFPKHLTFALGEEYISYKDLVQIILWCLPSGVSAVSFYDHKNEINAEKLYKAFHKSFNELAPCIKWGVSFSKELRNDKFNHNLSTPNLQVNVLTSKHGRQLLIDSIKELSSKPDLKLEDRAATEAALEDVMLSKLCYCGNPDLLVINGHVYTTYGLSPWHVGFTEFLLIPSYRLITVYDFVKILKTYADCEQKFGR